jgi:uncharacterized protein YndB with AHSA1/START domain
MAASVDANDRELVITRVFDAPRHLVFQAWIDQAAATRWWGPEGFTVEACAMDVRPGGAWSKRMRAADGREARMHGVYREIKAPERLVFTMIHEHTPELPETVVTLTFADLGGRTELTLRQAAFPSVAFRDSHNKGWNGALRRLAEHLEAA